VAGRRDRWSLDRTADARTGLHRPPPPASARLGCPAHEGARLVSRRGSAGRRAGFTFIYASAVMSAVSYSIVIPILPLLVQDVAGGDAATAAIWMMWFPSLWGLAQFVSSPVLGALADRYGRRPVLLLSTLGLGVDFLFMACAPTLPLLLIGRFLGGATAASFTTAYAYVSDVAPAAQRTAAFGRLSSAISIGFIVGPVLGGLLGEISLRLPYLVAAAITLLHWLYGLFILPESLPTERRAKSGRLFLALRTSALSRVAKSGPLRTLAVTSFFLTLSNMIWVSVWILFCYRRFGWSPLEMGVVTCASGAVGIIVQTWIVGRVADRIGDKRTLLAGLTVGALTLLYAAFAPNGWWYIACLPPAALVLLAAPSLQAMISQQADPAEQGQIRGAIQSLNALATVVGPIIYGATFAWAIKASHDVDLSGISLIVAAAFMAVAFLVGSRTPEEKTVHAERPGCA